MNGDPHAVQISVDGSCYPNEGRKAGYAGLVVYPGDDTEHQVVFQGFEESTINRMELSACIADIQKRLANSDIHNARWRSAFTSLMSI